MEFTSYTAANKWGKQHFPAPTARQAKALKTYQNNGFRAINGHLRGSKDFFGDPIEISDTLRGMIPDLDEVMIGAPERLRAYRATDLIDFGLTDIADAPRLVGTTLRDPGYLSTTLRPDVKELFPDQARKVFVDIDIPKGSQCYHMPSAFAKQELGATTAFAESELLLARGSNLLVTEVEVRGEELWIKAVVL